MKEKKKTLKKSAPHNRCFVFVYRIKKKEAACIYGGWGYGGASNSIH